ncbi:MAG TPA: glycosyltransferase family 39 protein [Planctomycetota bacterium]|nr:glycosyltransferase family 39 protein [Planctomycetota bacterium]
MLEKRRTAPFLLLALAALTGLWSIGHELPHSYYSDEEHLVKRALSFGSGDLNPHWFHKPTFFMYVLFAEYAIYYLAGRALGLWESVTDFAVGYIIDPSAFILLGRLTNVCLRAAAVWLLWRTVKRHFGERAAFLSGLMLCLSAGVVASSQQVKEDTLSMFLAVLSLHWTLDHVETRRLSRLLLAAAAAGLGTATKLYPAMMALPIGMALLLARPDAGTPRLPAMARAGALATAVFILAFFAGAPYCFLDPLGRESTFGRVTRLFEQKADAGPEVGPGDNFIQRPVGHLEGAAQYVGVLISPGGLGPVIGGIALAGLVWAVVRGGARARIAVAFPLALGVASVAAYPGYAGTRHQIALYPFLCIAGGLILARVGARWPRARTVLHATLGIALLFPAHAIVSRALERSREETRNAAKGWIEENIPAGTRLVLSENGPPLLETEEQLADLLEKARQADRRGQFTAHFATYLQYRILAARGRTCYHVAEIRMAWWRAAEPEGGLQELATDYDRDAANPLKKVGVRDYDDYLQDGYRYAVVHSDSYGLFQEGSRPSRDRPAYYRFYRDLFRRGRLVKEFSRDGGYSGPTVRIYELVRSS